MSFELPDPPRDEDAATRSPETSGRDASSAASLPGRCQRPRYAPSSTKADWIAYSERLEARIKDLTAVLLEIDAMLLAGSSPGPIHTRIEEALI